MSENPKYKDNLIVNLSFDFAMDIIAYTEILEKNKKIVLSNQILKCGTSIGANIKEAQNAESKNDFIHKLKIALKKLMKLNIGYFCVNMLKIIHTQIYKLKN